MKEKDNCPNCGTPCNLERRPEEGEAESRKEIAYATCSVCKTTWRRRKDQSFGTVIYEQWKYKIPGFRLSIPGIPIEHDFSPKKGRWVKIGDEQLSRGVVMPRTSENKRNAKENIVKKRILLKSGGMYYEEFKLSEGEVVKGEVLSDQPIDIYFLDRRNLKKTLDDEDFCSQDEEESVYQTNLNFRAVKDDLWYVLMANRSKKDAKVTYNLRSP